MEKRQQTREEWEQEVRQSQNNVLYEDRMRNMQNLLRKVPPSDALISKWQGIMFVVVVIAVAIAFVAFVLSRNYLL